MTPRSRPIFFAPAVSLFEECVWRPAVDVLRCPQGWLIKAELPGVRVDQVRVALRGNSVVLSGVRRDTYHEEGESYYKMEISYCRFERRIELPCPVEDAEVRLSTDNGLLFLRLVSGTPERLP
ncbi:MAG: Hsp20/alpha crystallin family protein [Gemmatimonadetes bacterium]|nr:Hsp20/alpha crystallin family protein [Gemmatimonadota bacterium]